MSAASVSWSLMTCNGVHPQRDRGVGVAEPGSDHMDGDASKQQGRGVNMPQIVQTSVR